MKKFFLLAGWIAACALLLSCNAKRAEKTVAPAPVPPFLLLSEKQMDYVRLDTVKSIPAVEPISAMGEISFDEDNVVRIYPIVSGAVETVEVSLGDYVKKGQLLATLLSTDISEYQRDYNVAKSNYEVQEKNLDRVQQLYTTGVLSDRELAEARNDYNNALSEFNERKQVLELYGGSASNLDAVFRVTAPRSGYIVERNINSGTQIRTDNGTNIFTISDLKEVWVWANVHESDLRKVHEGDAVKVETIAYPERSFSGKINKIGTMLDPVSRVVRVRTELNNHEGLLRPEMFATIIITPTTKEVSLAVPTEAIVLESNQYYVMRKRSDREFEKIRIMPGRTLANFTEIKSGLAAGDLIVTKGSLFVLTSFNQL